MKKFTKLLIAIACLSLLNGCLGIGEGTPTSSSTSLTAGAGEILYKGSNLSIIIPDTWEILEKDSFTTTIPTGTIVVFRNNIKDDIFTANVNISSRALKTDINSTDYAKETLINAKKNLIEFKELGKETLIIGEEETYITKFEGRKSVQDPKLTFQQLFLVKNKVAYIVTAAYKQDEDENIVKSIDKMLHSFSLN
ncbi:MAG: hypothetical protein WC806_01450 [Candidatus Gracilibacteria bacterium]|jgi:hypothetical protein